MSHYYGDPENERVVIYDNNNSSEYIRTDLVPQWQQIETAPKDRPFLARVSHIGKVMVVEWDQDMECLVVDVPSGSWEDDFEIDLWCDFIPPPAT